MHQEDIESLQDHHILAAAAELDRHPGGMSAPKKYRVAVGERWYTPRDLLRKAWVLAGYPPDLVKHLDGSVRYWRRHLRNLGYLIDESGSCGPVATPSRPRAATANDLTPTAVRAAARAWDGKPEAFQTRRPSIRYDVLIDGKLYPPRAIGILAADQLGLARPHGRGFDHLQGAWYQRFEALDFPLVEIPTMEVAGPWAWMDSSVPTEAHRWGKFRLTQEAFRRNLVRLRGERCAVTGIKEGEMLIAAHIVPWAESLGTRMDPANGLLLSAHLDRLFEHGRITFDATGKIVIDRDLSHHTRQALQLHAELHLTPVPSARQQDYLAQHRVKHIKAGRKL